MVCQGEVLQMWKKLTLIQSSRDAWVPGFRRDPQSSLLPPLMGSPPHPNLFAQDEVRLWLLFKVSRCLKLGKRGMDGRKWRAWPNSPEKHPNPVETPEGRHGNTALRWAPDGMGRLWASAICAGCAGRASIRG